MDPGVLCVVSDVIPTRQIDDWLPQREMWGKLRLVGEFGEC